MRIDDSLIPSTCHSCFLSCYLCFRLLSLGVLAPSLGPVCRVLLGPRESIVGDLFPPLLGRHEMRASRKFPDLCDRVRLVVLRVRALDCWRHQVIFAPRDEEKGRASVVMVVDRDLLGAGDEIRQDAVPENGP